MLFNMNHPLAPYIKTIECIESQLFGKPSLKAGKHHFACFFKEALVVKIGAEAIQHRSKEFIGSELFDPSGKGRPMKDWLQIPVEYEAHWEHLISDAYNRATADL